MHAQKTLGGAIYKWAALFALRVIGAINILACHNFPLYVIVEAFHLQFCNSLLLRVILGIAELGMTLNS